METSIVLAIITLITAPVAAVVAWTLNKKKSKADVSSAIATASGEAVDAIKDVMVALRYELVETQKELEKFKQQNKELEHSLYALKMQNELLLQQNNTLASEIALLKAQVDRFVGNV